MKAGSIQQAVPFGEAHPVLKTMLQFGGVGAGAGALVALVKELKEAMEEREREKERNSNGIAAGTIVLRVPKSKAKDIRSTKKAEIASVKRVPKRVGSRSYEVKACSAGAIGDGGDGKPRDSQGRFVEKSLKPTLKEASTGAWTRTKEILGGVAALPLGYVAISALREKLRQIAYKKRIEAAQTAYIDLIDGNGKVAEWLCGAKPEEKTAGAVSDIADLFGGVNDSIKNVGAGGMAAFLAAMLGSGWIANKVLRSRFDEPEDDEELPKVNRIVFREYDDRPGHKKASDDKYDEYEVGYGETLAMLQAITDSMKVNCCVKEAADYSFLDKVLANSDGRQWLLDAYAVSKGKSRPAFEQSKIPGLSMLDKIKYAPTLIGIRRHGDRHMPEIAKYVAGDFKSNPREWFSLVGKKGNRDLVGALASEFVRSLVGGSQKAASVIPGPQDLIAMAARSRTLSDKTNKELDRKLDEVLSRLGAKKSKKRKSNPMKSVKVESDDDGYVMEHGKEIANAISALKRKGMA